MLERPSLGGSNEYPLSIFAIIRKNVYPKFTLQKCSVSGYTLHGHIHGHILLMKKKC